MFRASKEPQDRHGRGRSEQHRLRDRLIQVIEAETGRKIERDQQGFPKIGVWKDQKNYPYYYKWCFTTEYQSFPDRKLSDWTVAEVMSCNLALDNNHLSVANLRQNSTSNIEEHFPSVSKYSNLDHVTLRRRFREKISEHIISRTTLLDGQFTLGDSLSTRCTNSLEGWQWRLPTTGGFMRFPSNNIGNWKTVSLQASITALESGKMELVQRRKDSVILGTEERDYGSLENSSLISPSIHDSTFEYSAGSEFEDSAVVDDTVSGYSSENESDDQLPKIDHKETSLADASASLYQDSSSLPRNVSNSRQRNSDRSDNGKDVTDLRRDRLENFGRLLEDNTQALQSVQNRMISHLGQLEQSDRELRSKLTQMKRSVEQKTARVEELELQIERTVVTSSSNPAKESTQSLVDELLRGNQTLQNENQTLEDALKQLHSHLDARENELKRTQAEASEELAALRLQVEQAQSSAKNSQKTAEELRFEIQNSKYRADTVANLKAVPVSYEKGTQTPDAPRDGVRDFVEIHRGFDTPQKILYLNIIDQRWRKTLHEIFPISILPITYVLDDRCLGLLARLSQEQNPSEASRLIYNEVDRRSNTPMSKNIEAMMTYQDIKNVLDDAGVRYRKLPTSGKNLASIAAHNSSDLLSTSSTNLLNTQKRQREDGSLVTIRCVTNPKRIKVEDDTGS